MNRTRYLGLSLLTLLCYMTAAAQGPTVTKCEYWIDQQFDSRTTVTMTGTEWNSSIDISALRAGLHSIAFRVADNNGLYSSALTKNFLLVQGTGTGDNSLQTYEYWFDQKFDAKKSGAIPTGGVINIDEDISALNHGLHNIAMRVIDKNGVVSSALTKNFLLVQGTGTGDNSLQTYEYWFDQKFDAKKSGTIPTGGVINIDEDISALNYGLHSIAMRVIDKNGVVSSALTKNFLLVQGTGTGDNSLQTYEYWIDQDFGNRKSGEIPTGGVVNIDEDISALNYGLHSIAMRVIDKNGIVSSVLTKNFMKIQQQDGDNALTTYEYWIDNGEHQNAAIPADGVVALDLDISALTNGLHTFNYMTRDKAGLASATTVKNFLVKKVEGDGKLIAIDYWFNDEPRQRITIDPAESVDKSDIVIPMDGVKPRTISEEYTFDATTKTVKTTETITVGIQVFNDGGVGSEAVVHTLENVTLTVTPLFEALANESSATKAAPKDGQMQGFSYTGAVGDELYWDITGSDAKVDFKDAEGNTITTTTKEIGGKTVIVLTMPTTTVYLLAYGATSDNDIVVKVAQPVTLTVANATREYGDANPAFTYTSSGAAVTGEVAYTTTADVTSAVGDYPVTIDLTGVTNTYVSVVPGTLTIEKATLKVGVADASMTAGEQLPVFSLTYEGFKNGEDETVLTTLPQVTTDATSSSEPGDYVLTVSGGEATNYTFTYTNGTLTIEVPTGIQQISVDRPVNVYTLGGVLVRRGATTLDGLSDGVYIINGKKVYVRRKR